MKRRTRLVLRVSPGAMSHSVPYMCRGKRGAPASNGSESPTKQGSVVVDPTAPPGTQGLKRRGARASNAGKHRSQLVQKQTQHHPARPHSL